MLTVEVPLNTMLADLDETLRDLLKDELERHGFEGVDIAFDAPAREWSGQLSKPTVNIFLYDLREAETLRTQRVVADDQATGARSRGRPPMVMECSYAVTAWTQAVEDEHRLLSQVLAIFYAYPGAPAGRAQRPARQRLPGRGRSRRASVRARARSRTSGARSAGSTRCRSITSCACRSSPGAKLERGPEVRTQTVRTRLTDGPARDGARDAPLGRHASPNKKGEPLADVWVTLPDVGTWTASTSDGRVPLRPPAPRPPPPARTHGGRPGGRRAS